MEKLSSYINTVHTQIGQLVDPTRPEPTQEQLFKYITSVVATLSKLLSDAPPVVKERISVSFGAHWDMQKNCVGKDGINPLQLLASFKMMKDQLDNLKTQRSMGKGGAGAAAAGGAPAEAGTGPQPKRKYGGETTTEIKILDNADLVGRIVGPGGKQLQQIEFESGVKLDINGEAVSITGPKDGVEVALKAIDDIITKGYCTLAHGDDFKEEQYKVHPKVLPSLIGPGWCIIKKIKEACEVEIGITDNGKKGGKDGKGQMKKATIVIGGAKSNVEKAKEIFHDLTTKQFHEVTHPGKVCREIEVPWDYLNLLIGKGGSEIRHMQNSYDVNVTIPNEINNNEHVMVVGEKHRVDQCEKHINSIITRAASRPERGEEHLAGGGDGYQDEPVEDWMQQYMYKR